MRYALLIYGPDPTEQVPDDAMQAEMDAYAAFTRSIVESGQFKGGEALQPTPTATTVRVRDGNTLTTDGPFAETKEQLGGFYLVEARDLDEAVEIAARIPGAARGSIEIRPVMELPPEYAEAAGQAGTAAG